MRIAGSPWVFIDKEQAKWPVYNELHNSRHFTFVSFIWQKAWLFTTIYTRWEELLRPFAGTSFWVRRIDNLNQARVEEFFWNI
jgi:hypothetical protein